MPQVVEELPSKCKAMSSNPSIIKGKKKEFTFFFNHFYIYSHVYTLFGPPTLPTPVRSA
jgi:hypothetical protein